MVTASLAITSPESTPRFPYVVRFCLFTEKHPERTKLRLGRLIQSSLAREQENLVGGTSGEKRCHSRYDCLCLSPRLRPQA